MIDSLGIRGWDRLEPVVVAALTLEAPVLLIGPHGTAKSLLLNRLAGALGLRHRHYNASLLNFDDLVGYPVPSEDRSELRYIQTPGTIWGAESVFFDEISRCRVDLANKLFPIVHERVVQGVALRDLRFRWAAMNPPSLGDADDDAEGEERYRGSEPLDPALADRFPFVLEVPHLSDLGAEDRRAVISGRCEEPQPRAAARLREAIALVRRCLLVVRSELSDAACEYVETLLPLLERMRRGVSARRARFLHDNILAVHAARVALAPRADPGDSASLALRSGLPHAATGRALDAAKLLGAHKQAWALVRLPALDPRRVVLSEPDSVRRVALGLRFELDALELSSFVLDAYAELPPWKRVVFAAALYPAVSERVDLTAAAFEPIAEVQAQLENSVRRKHSLTPGSPRFELWKSVVRARAALGKESRAEKTLHNLLLVIFERDEGPFDPGAVALWFGELVTLFGWES